MKTIPYFLSRLFKISFKVVIAGALINITAIIFFLPRTIISASGPKNVESFPQPIIQSNSKDQIDHNFTCQYDSKGVIAQKPRISIPGLLKDIDDIVVAKESIFFIETSCSADLNSRQSCAVESAARANPEKQVYVLFISPVANLGPGGGRNLKKLHSIYDNIHFHYLDIINFTKGTKMEKWVKNQKLRTSSYKENNLSNGLRLLTLCKYGGIYFDLDVVVMKSLQNMCNFAGDQSEETVCNAVIGMKGNSTLVNACLDEFVNNFRGNMWGYNGDSALERVIRKTCKKETRSLWKNCDGDFFIYPPKTFYPIPYQKWRAYFQKSDPKKFDKLFGDSIAVHLWSEVSARAKVKVGADVVYGDIASKYCPLSYWSSGQYF